MNANLSLVKVLKGLSNAIVKHLLSGLLLVVLLPVLVGVTGCGLFHKKSPPVTYNDPQLKEKVESALKSEPVLGNNRITVQSNNGVVELRGEVDSIAVKERAGLAAASVPGIVQVKNDVLVRKRPQ